MAQRKFLFILTLTLILGMTIAIFQVAAQPPTPPTGSSVPVPPTFTGTSPPSASPPAGPPAAPPAGDGIEIKNPLKFESIPELINAIINAIFWIAVVLAPLMILVGAFYFMTAGGNPERVKTGQKIILWTIVGLAVILFSRGIISVIRSILG